MFLKSLRTKTATATQIFAFLPALALGQDLTLWPSSVQPSTLDGGDGQAVELGLKFLSDVAGSVTGVRFYKASANTGAHIGNLWTSSGTKLATVTFTAETASGWQQAYFSTPVAIQANVTYIVSYYAPVGHYSISQSYFGSTQTDNAPLHAPIGSNGIYRYGTSSRFPTQSWYSSNYWVDVIFRPNVSTPPTTSMSFWDSSVTPAVVDGGDTNSVELGLQFTSDTSGFVTGVKFYKGPNNTGMHVGNLWTSTRLQLASVTFTNETASGWQQASFATPVAIQANADYVISYFAPAHYSTTQGFFSTNGVDVAPLHAPAVTNGTYAYGASSSFPDQTWNATNYWVDVIFQPDSATATAATNTALSSSPNPSTAGQPVMFTATVTAASGTPTGSVQFRDGSTVLVTATLAAGSASLATSSLGAGTHSITASYSGDSTYSGSASPALVQTVNSSQATTTALSSSANPSVPGQAVTFTAMVTAASGTPTGSVQFIDGSTVLATAVLGSGVASVTITSLAAGTHSITASYGGDGTHSGSSSLALSQQVQQVNAHSASLTWTASTSANVVGYNVYRGSAPGGPYMKLNSSMVAATDYTDAGVQAGQTYYFVCTAVDATDNESGYSNEAQAVVPSP